MNLKYQTQNLSDLATISYGYTASASFDISGPRFLRITDIQDGNVRWEEVPSCEINAVDHKKHKLKVGDIVFARTGATTGKSYILLEDVDAVAASYLIKVRFTSQSVEPRFVWYFFQSPTYWHSISSGTTGSAQGGFNASKLGALDIPIPPLEEQKRIVAVLDEAFAGIGKATANIESNLTNARELLAAMRREKFNGLLETFPTVTLGEICQFENGDRGANYPGKQHRVAEGVPFINAGHLTETGIDFSEMDYITPERFALLGNGKVRPNDVLFCLRGSLGKFSCVNELDRGAIASSLVILRPSDKLNLTFLLEYLSAPICAAMIAKYKGGAAQPNLGAKDLKNFEIPLPPIRLQQSTAAYLSSLAERTRELEQVYCQKKQSVDELKRCLLHKAFSGQFLLKERRANVEVGAFADTTSPQYTADVLAFAYAKHRAAQRDRTFGRVKGQKVLHLVEAIAGVDLGRDPIKDAAGPNDSAHMRRAEEWAAQQGYFAFEARGTGGYDFRPGQSFEKTLASAYARLSSHRAAIAKVIDLLVPLDSQEAEVVATVLAAWNNLIIGGIEPTRDAVIAEARENWTPSKLEIPVSKFENAFRFIRQNDLVPDGSAKLVRKRQESLF